MLAENPAPWQATILEPDTPIPPLAPIELYWREPIAIVQYLVANPQLREGMQFAPVKVFEEEDGKQKRIFSEMWTGEWWWRMQVCGLLT